MRKTHAIFKELPLEAGKRYQTKFATGEFFIVNRVESHLKNGTPIKNPIAFGVYENCPHLGECPLSEDRIIHDKVFEREVEICGECGKGLDEDLSTK